MFWSRMHCCYIVIGGGFKEKHILEQGEVFSSGLKEKNVLCDYVKKCRRNKKNLVLFSFSRAPYPFLLLRDPGLLINLPKNRLSQYWSFSFSTNSSNEYSGLLSFRINCWSPCCPRDPWESSLAPQFESINSLVLSLLYGPALMSIEIDYWKNHSFDYTDLCGQSWCLCFLIHMDITRWPIPKSDWSYSLQLKMEKFYTVSKNKNGSKLWLK